MNLSFFHRYALTATFGAVYGLLDTFRHTDFQALTFMTVPPNQSLADPVLSFVHETHTPGTEVNLLGLLVHSMFSFFSEFQSFSGSKSLLGKSLVVFIALNTLLTLLGQVSWSRLSYQVSLKRTLSALESSRRLDAGNMPKMQSPHLEQPTAMLGKGLLQVSQNLNFGS